jgi:N-acetylneuraminate lyase
MRSQFKKAGLYLKIHMFQKIQGLIAAPVVPLNPDGTVNLSVIPKYVQMLHRNKVEGVFVNGTTGEGLSLTLKERKAVAKAWVEAAPLDFKIIIHVGHTALTDCCDLAAHAEDIGAWGIGSIGSIFFKPSSLQDTADWCAHIANAAPKLPFYYYHIPSLSGINLIVADLLPLVEKIPNFHGVKYTFETLMDFENCRRYANGKYNMLYGRDEMYLSAAVLGNRAAIGSTYNVFAPLYLKMIDKFEHGDLSEAQRLQRLSHDLIMTMLHSGNFFAALKGLLGIIGIPCGGLRFPQKELSTQKMNQFLNEVQNLGFNEVKNQ